MWLVYLSLTFFYNWFTTDENSYEPAFELGILKSISLTSLMLSFWNESTAYSLFSFLNGIWRDLDFYIPSDSNEVGDDN